MKTLYWLMITIVLTAGTAFAAGTPWSSTTFNNNPDNFQFAIFSDVNGGERPGIFDDAVGKLNLLRPEFVICVGDLIRGYTTDADAITRQYEAFDARAAKLLMPFYHVPGNHDLTNTTAEKLYKERYGSTYSSFVYKNVLFLVLDTEDPPGGDNIGDEQLTYVKKALADNAQVRWTLLFMHKPLWLYEKSNWGKLAELLKGRSYTTFAGHYHSYISYLRDGHQLIRLGTTGGDSNLFGSMYGAMDHLVWVTMTENGPVMANLLLDGILPADYRDEETARLSDSFRYSSNLVVEPIYNNGEPFTAGTARLQLHNPTDLPLRFTAKFYPPAAITPTPGMVDVELPAKTDRTVEVKLAGAAPLAMTEDMRLFFDLRVSAKLPDGRPLEKSYPGACVPVVRMLDCPRAEVPVNIDGKLDEWKALPFNLDTPGETITDPKDPWTGPTDAGCRFAVKYDDKYVYFAAAVTDDAVVSDPKKLPWEQDGLEVRLDARPEPQRGMGRGQGEGDNFLLVPLSPGETAAKTVSLYQKKLPEGTKTACVKTATGYNVEIALPVSYLNEKQKAAWSAFRLNVAMDDRDLADGPFTYLSWRGDWRRDANYAGSGTFMRK